MNEKMMTLTFSRLTIYMKKLGQFFPKLISSAKSYKYFEQVNKLSIKTKVLAFFKNTLYIPTISLINLRKRKIHMRHHHMPNLIYACI